MLFIATVIAAAVSAVLATALALRIAKDPTTHVAVDRPTGLEWSPFWVFHFISPRKLRMLSPKWRPIAVASLALMIFALGSLAYLLIRFIRDGATL